MEAQKEILRKRVPYPGRLETALQLVLQVTDDYVLDLLIRHNTPQTKIWASEVSTEE